MMISPWSSSPSQGLEGFRQNSSSSLASSSPSSPMSALSSFSSADSAASSPSETPAPHRRLAAAEEEEEKEEPPPRSASRSGWRLFDQVRFSAALGFSSDDSPTRREDAEPAEAEEATPNEAPEIRKSKATAPPAEAAGRSLSDSSASTSLSGYSSNTEVSGVVYFNVDDDDDEEDEDLHRLALGQRPAAADAAPRIGSPEPFGALHVTPMGGKRVAMTPVAFNHRALNSEAKSKSNNDQAAPTFLKFASGAVSIPMAGKTNDGEDAYFSSPCGRGLGVADGVGAWVSLGIDVGKYSRRLMSNCSSHIFQQSKEHEVCPMTTLTTAYADMGDLAGTTTACVVTLHGNVLTAVNLGDSGFMVLRPRRLHTNANVVPASPNGGRRWSSEEDDVSYSQRLSEEEEYDDDDSYDAEIAGHERIEPRSTKPSFYLGHHQAYSRTLMETESAHSEGSESDCAASGWVVVKRSKEQQHFWNCPKQMGTQTCDKPTDADRYRVAVQAGDLIVMATDGVLDNLFDDEIVQLVSSKHVDEQGLKTVSSVQSLADHIANASLMASLDSDRETPFSLSARLADMCFYGGKQDDITVVCAAVLEDSGRSPSPTENLNPN